jgi:hypothetical protein
MRSLVLTLLGGSLALAPLRSSDLPTQNLPVYGGSGGSAFSRSCGDNRVLSGMRYRAGLVIDAVGLLCRPVNADGSLGSETTIGTLAGGGGGSSGSASCPSGKVVTGAMIYHGTYVSRIVLFCRAWVPATRRFGAATTETQAGFGPGTGARSDARCEASAQPARAIRGREASLVDAIGFVCDEP